MPVIGNRFPTITDHANSLDPNGAHAATVEVLRQHNEILDDMVYIEGNLPTGHETTYRAELPDIDLVGYNEGVKPSKSRKAKLNETCAALMGFSEVDKRLVELAGKKAEFLASEDEAFVQSFNNKFTDVLMNGAATDPKNINGFLTRYSKHFNFSDKVLEQLTLKNVINAGGTGQKCGNLLLVGWGKETVTGIFPKGTKAGFSIQEMGLQTINGDGGKKFVGYQTQYTWEFGLCIRDPRFVVRVMNIDLEQLTKDAKAGADLIDLMVDAVETLEDANVCRPVFYCGREIRKWLRKQITNKDNVNLTTEQIAGRKVTAFDGIPVRRVDALDIPEVAETP